MHRTRSKRQNPFGPARRHDSVVVTTSWDDGHLLDQKLAELLHRYGVKGTFYVAPENVELDARLRLGPEALRALADEFEIGGHTLNHVRLTTIPDEVAAQEISSGKDVLEQTLGARLRAFCYPGGAYDHRHVPMVRDAGFEMARTVRRGVAAVGHPFEVDTTVHAYRHLVDGPTVLRLAGGNLAKARRIYWNWDDLAIEVFDRMSEAGGVFHLWGHSWEIDDHGDWGRLERVLCHIGNRPGVRYVDNGELAGLAAS